MEATLLVMAAGMGSRYGGSKQVDPMGPNGEIILDYSVYDAIQAGFQRVIFIVRKDFVEGFRADMDSKLKGKIQTDYVCQEINDIPPGFNVPSGREKPWGTGHAILCSRKILQSSFAVINADDFYGRETFEIAFQELIRRGDSLKSGFLVGYQLDKTLSPHGHVTRGVCETQNAMLKRIVERKSIAKNADGTIEFTHDNKKYPIAANEITSMNFWGFSADFMDMLQERFTSFLSESVSEVKSEYILPDVVDYFINNGRLTIDVLNSNAQWFGVTYKEDKPKVQAELAKIDSYPCPLWA